MGFASEPARPTKATIVQGAIETMARHRFGNETSQTFHVRAPAFYAAAPTKRGSPICRLRGLRVALFSCRAPGEGSGNGHRASFRNPATSFGFPASASGVWFRRRAYGSESPGACAFFDLRRAPSHLWPAPDRLVCITALLFRPIPVRRNLCAWDCKVTPASCACQEGNTIGCIPSNDGLDAGVQVTFSTLCETPGCCDLLKRWQNSLVG